MKSSQNSAGKFQNGSFQIGSTKRALPPPNSTCEYIETAMFGLHAIEKALVLLHVSMIDLYRYADATATRDFLRSVFDSAGHPIYGRRTATDGPAGDINGGRLFTKRHRDAASATPTGSGDHCHFALQPVRHRFKDIPPRYCRQTGNKAGRAWSHRIPLAGLKCLSEKRRREMEVCLVQRLGK